MESRTKILGHPVHPMIIVIPLGLFITAVIFDLIQLFTHSSTLPIVSYYNIAGGILGGLLAALFGFRDWLAIPKGTRARSVGAAHGIGNVILVVLFLLSWLMRRGEPGFVPSTLALIFSFVGILLGTLTAWLGGELVYRLDVAVDQGANLDAPNSLSGEPARVSQRLAVPVTGENAGTREKEDKENF